MDKLGYFYFQLLATLLAGLPAIRRKISMQEFLVTYLNRIGERRDQPDRALHVLDESDRGKKIGKNDLLLKLGTLVCHHHESGADAIHKF